MKRPSLASLRRSSVCRLHGGPADASVSMLRVKDTALRAPLINRHFANVGRALTYKFSISSLYINRSHPTRPHSSLYLCTVLTLGVSSPTREHGPHTPLMPLTPTSTCCCSQLAVQRDAHTDRDSWKRSTALERRGRIHREFCCRTPKSALFCVNGRRLDLRGSECCADSQSAAPHLGGTPSDTGLAH